MFSLVVVKICSGNHVPTIVGKEVLMHIKFASLFVDFKLLFFIENRLLVGLLSYILANILKSFNIFSRIRRNYSIGNFIICSRSWQLMSYMYDSIIVTCLLTYSNEFYVFHFISILYPIDM